MLVNLLCTVKQLYLVLVQSSFSLSWSCSNLGSLKFYFLALCHLLAAASPNTYHNVFLNIDYLVIFQNFGISYYPFSPYFPLGWWLKWVFSPLSLYFLLNVFLSPLMVSSAWKIHHTVFSIFNSSKIIVSSYSQVFRHVTYLINMVCMTWLQYQSHSWSL